MQLAIKHLFSFSIASIWLVSTAFGQPAYIESGGVVVGEAEQFNARTSMAGDAAWTVVPDEGASIGDTFENFRGTGFVQTQPNGAGGLGATMAPSIDYRMSISTPGTYQLYLRWDGYDGGSDSLFADIIELTDGPGGTIADWYEYAGHSDDNFATTPWEGTAGFETNNAGGTPKVPAVFDIASEGVYTLRVSQREDGVAFDSFVFQLDNLAAPTGIGPPVSEFAELAVPEPASIAIWSLIGLGLAGFGYTRIRRKK